jgi:signal transduction histidine kinase
MHYTFQSPSPEVKHEVAGGGRARGGELLFLMPSRKPHSSEEGQAVAHFGSRVAHEVRNPLSSIKMVIQTLARAPHLDERGKRRLTLAAREIRTIERVLSALAELSRATSEHSGNVELPAAITASLQACEPDLKDRGLVARAVPAQSLPRAKCDPERFRLALTHLVSSVAHGMRTGELEVEARAEGQGVALLVRRTGSGARAPISKGDLSIALVEKIVKENGGRLVTEAEGISYGFWLPVT